MLKRAIAVGLALLITFVAFVAFRLPRVLPAIESFGTLVQFVCALILLVAAVAVHRRTRSWATLVLLIGSAGLSGAYLHDTFMDLGIRYGWFQFGGSDSYVLQGFFEPRENPLIAIPAETMRFASLLTVIGIFLLAANVVEKHLTKRCSEPLAAPRSRFR